MREAEHIDERELARRMWGRYLRNEWRYDKFGAQGKLILLQEALTEAGIDPGPGFDHRRVVNTVFPRTFACERDRAIDAATSAAIVRYADRLQAEFAACDLPSHLARSLSLSEAGEKFCLPAAALAELARAR
jgi:hypothetical protein